jgi:adenosine deaminase
MVTPSHPFSYLFVNPQLITHQSWAGGEDPFPLVTRHLFLRARELNPHLPDRHFTLQLNHELETIGSLSALLSIGVHRFASEYLEMRDKQLFVKPERFNEWINLTLYVPPMFLATQFLVQELPLSYEIGQYDEIRQQLLPFLKRTYHCSTLLHPYAPQLTHFIKEVGGLSDLHFHINGTIEPLHVWLDAIAVPEVFCRNLKDGKRLKELAQQSDVITSLSDLEDWLMRAKNLRTQIANHLFSPVRGEGAELISDPFLTFFNDSDDTKHFFSELLLYLFVGKEMLGGKDSIAKEFYEYLCIQSMVITLLVHQPQQYGFEQFQKITSTDLRDTSEREYVRQFRQLFGEESGAIHRLEGRFAPKPKAKQTLVRLKPIQDGWKTFTKGGDNKALSLVAHVIKMRDSSSADCDYRFQGYYGLLTGQARSISTIIRRQQGEDEPKDIIPIVGVDAAGSEFHTPPYVLSPLYRALRREGVNHFTYHAGEDFFTITGGLRAIYEAVEFCELGRGDRIGHGCATAIDPDLFTGQTVKIPTVEYLDDLLFCYEFINSRNIKELTALVPHLAEAIRGCSVSLYDQEWPISQLIGAWRLRRFHPLIVLSPNTDVDHSLLITEEEIKACREEDRHIPLSLTLAYHDLFLHSERAKQLTTVSSLIDNNTIRILQQELLSYLHTKEIVIETLPTSNVMIGPHKSLATHHLWTWLQWEKEGKAIPPIVVGSDDPGIFTTNIRSEYERLYCHMVYGQHRNQDEVVAILERLENNSRIYAFENL